MTRLEDLIKDIADSRLRDQIAREVGRLKSRKKFGLVFEELSICLKSCNCPICPSNREAASR